MVLFSEQEIARLRERLKQDDSVLQGLYRGCERVKRFGVKVPKTGIATWGHYFVCPADSASLVYEYETDRDFRCPACGRVYNGEPYLGAWWRNTNGVSCATAYQAALLWVLNGEEDYRALSGRILSAFADNYPNYEEHGGIPYNKPGRMNAQALCEASCFQQLAMAYDMVKDTLPPDERRRMEENLFVPGAQLLMKNRTDQLHNHEVIVNAGVGMIGMAIGREEFIDFAVNSRYGLKYQLEHGLLDDGMWFEATFHYHFYALLSFMAYEKMAFGTPYSLLGMPQYRRMYRMALRTLQPDFSVAHLGDGGTGRFFQALAGHYEFAYRVYGDPEFAGILNEVYAQYPRQGLEPFLFGAESIEPAPLPPLEDYHNDRGSGLTIMRGSDRRQYLLLRHGRYGGEHDHYDKLGLHYMVGEHEVMPDLGTVLYGAPQHYGYFKNTFTHNTVCVNAQNQPPCDGYAVRYEKTDGETLVEGHADWLGAPPQLDSFTIRQWDEASYAGVRMERTILHRDEYFLEAFRVRGAAGRQVDWIIHPTGACTEPEAEKRPVALGETEPIRYMKNARGFQPEGVVHTAWQGPAGRFNVWSACSRPALAIYAEGPANPPTSDLTYLIRRDAPAGDDVVFAAIFQLERDGGQIERPEIRIDGGRVTVRLLWNGQPREHSLTVGEAD